MSLFVDGRLSVFLDSCRPYVLYVILALRYYELHEISLEVSKNYRVLQANSTFCRIRL